MSNNINGLTSTHSSTSRSRAQSSTRHLLTLLRGEPTALHFMATRVLLKIPPAF